MANDTVLVPGDYVCGNCSRIIIPEVLDPGECKLWHCPDCKNQELLCCNCAATYESVSILDIDDSGRRCHGCESVTDMIGRFVPAIPNGNGGYYPYDQIPDFAYSWWRNLPTEW